VETPPGAPDFPPELVKHTSYSDKYALSGLTAQRVNTVASAFRLLDDLIDEHHERRYRRADGRSSQPCGSPSRRGWPFTGRR